MIQKKLLTAVFVLCASVSLLHAQSGKEFSIPLDALKSWAENPTAMLNVKVTGHSRVHPVENDCEMHLGGQVTSYNGDPDGWVLEPMNVCVEPLPGTTTYSKAAWVRFADSLKNRTVTAKGIPRIWPEHLTSSGASNPAHAVELHPLLTLSDTGKSYDFSKLVYAPEGFSGGLKPETVTNILTGTTVSVTESEGRVNVNFESGRIGNFTTLSVRVLLATAEEINGSHRMDGEVILSQNQKVSVRLLTAAGSGINNTIAQLKQKGRKTATYDFLVLFSLDPVALYNAAKESKGQTVEVNKPLQLIVYGEGQPE